MVKRALIRVIDGIGLGRPARQMKDRLRSAGFGNWTPLVPEVAFTECIQAAVDVLLREEPAEAFGDYLEFGVSRGTSLACVFHVLQKSGLRRVRLIGFDSFEGLPPEAANEGWKPGDFRSTYAATHRYLTTQGVDFERVTIVKGWFRDTLTPETRSRLAIAKASLIMIDCDIYSASKEALAFCEPHIRERAVIVFDDWGWDADRIGQKEAFAEFLAEHPRLQAEPLPAYIPQARVFLVRDRG